MKKLIPLILLIALSISCSSNDDNEIKPTTAKLIGKWYFDSSAQGEDITDYLHACATSRDGIEFLANGSTVRTNFGHTCEATTNSNGSWTLNNFELKVNDVDPVNYLSGTFRVQQLSEFNMTLLQKVTPATGSSYNVYYYLVRN